MSRRGVLLILGLLLVATHQTYADDCAPMIREAFDNAGYVEATLIGMNSESTASYAKFDLGKTFSARVGLTSGAKKDLFQGRGKQLFNDRGGPPFQEAQSDELQLDVRDNLRVTLTLLSWSKGRITFTPSCDGGLMHGWALDGRTYFVLHLKPFPPIG